MNRYVYLDNESKGAISIKSKQRPGLRHFRKTGTMVVFEWDCGKWVMPCFPEITHRRLTECVYVGKVKV